MYVNVRAYMFCVIYAMRFYGFSRSTTKMRCVSRVCVLGKNGTTMFSAKKITHTFGPEKQCRRVRVRLVVTVGTKTIPYKQRVQRSHYIYTHILYYTNIYGCVYVDASVLMYANNHMRACHRQPYDSQDCDVDGRIIAQSAVVAVALIPDSGRPRTSRCE